MNWLCCIQPASTTPEKACRWGAVCHSLGPPACPPTRCAGLASVLLLAACSTGGGAPPAAGGAGAASTAGPAAAPSAAVAVAPTKPPEPARVRITDAQITSAAGSYIAAEKGYFREEGIEAESSPAVPTRCRRGRRPGRRRRRPDQRLLVQCLRAGYPAARRRRPRREPARRLGRRHGDPQGSRRRRRVPRPRERAEAGRSRSATRAASPTSPSIAGPERRARRTDVELVYLSFPDTGRRSPTRIEAAYYQEPFTTIAVDRGLIVRARSPTRCTRTSRSAYSCSASGCCRDRALSHAARPRLHAGGPRLREGDDRPRPGRLRRDRADPHRAHDGEGPRAVREGDPIGPESRSRPQRPVDERRSGLVSSTTASRRSGSASRIWSTYRCRAGDTRAWRGPALTLPRRVPARPIQPSG